jgi:hypothetical protein
MATFRLTVEVRAIETINIEADDEKSALAIFKSDDFSLERKVIEDLYLDGEVIAIKNLD